VLGAIAGLNGICSTTSPDESRASMKKRCAAWSNCSVTGNEGGGAVCVDAVETGAGDFGSVLAGVGGVGALGAGSRAGGVTGAAATI